MKEEYPFPFFDEKGRLRCQLCGKSFLVIAPAHLKRYHSNMTYSEYKLKFPKAPLTCEEFDVLGKYGKEKNIFVKKELEKIENEPEIQELDDDTEPTVDTEIVFQEVLDANPLKSKDICNISKDRILEHLRVFFTNIKKDYMIQIYENISERMLFEFISDFSDPFLKIDIEFPNTFWHNRMAYDDPNRNLKLKQHGWKIIQIKTNPPTFKDINNALKNL